MIRCDYCDETMTSAPSHMEHAPVCLQGGAPMTTAPDLTALARTAADAIVAYLDATDKACARVGAGDSKSATLYDVHATRDAAFRAVQELWLAPWGAGSRAPLLVLHDMRALLSAGIVRPEWAIRVVAIATRAAPPAKAVGRVGKKATNG